MKNQIRIAHYLALASLLFSLCLLSCHTSSKSETETTVGDYKTPKTIPLKFTEPESFKWETITSDTLTTPVSYSLDLDALPSKPFQLNKFKPLKSPMKQYDFDWDNFPVEPLTFDSVAFNLKKSKIKKPTVIKMKPPGIMEGTDVNLMQLSANQGLETNDISSFLEAEDGAMWIATPNSSLVRYDGENSFVYEYNFVYKMAFDKQGKLWMVHPGDNLVTILDFTNDIEYTFSLANSFVPLDIICDYMGNLYIISITDGLYRIDPDMKKLEKLKNTGPVQPWKIFEDSNNNLWLGASNGVAVMDDKRKEFKLLYGNPDYKLNSFIYDIKEDRSGHIWLSLPYVSNNVNIPDSSKVVRLSPKENTLNVLEKDNGYNVFGGEMVFDAEENLWIIGSSAAFILNKNRTTYKTIELNSKFIADRRLPRPLRKKDGTLWLATTDKGVIITNDYTLKTDYFDETNGLIDNQVWGIEENSRGEVWLATLAGINIIDLEKNTIKSLSHELLHSIPNVRITAINEIATDIYFIDNSSSFSVFDRKNNKITQYAKNENTPLNISSHASLNDHSFVLHTYQGLLLYDINNNTLKKAVSASNEDILIAEKRSVLSYNDDILWIPVFNGLAKVDLKSNNVSFLSEEQGLCHNRGSVAMMSKEGELWLATLNGVAILNLEEQTLTNLTEENGLIPAEMYDLIEKENIMYAASVNGLIPIDKSTAKTTSKGFYNFNGGLGFKSNDYLQGSPKFLSNGQFWSGVSSPSSDFKLLVLDGEPKKDSIKNDVYITNLFVMDENPEFGKKNISDSLKNKISSYAYKNNMQWDSVTFPYTIPKGLVLPYDQNSLSFSYGSGNLFNREQLSYRFILDGEDTDWTYARNATKTKNYYNLKPGNYIFKVSSRVSNQNWSDPAQFEFRIAPPWWQTWWAYVLFGIIIASILRAYIVFRARKLKKENKILDERVKHRTEQLNLKIDQLKATQSQLIQSEKMASLGELTAGIAHEIQNPLNFVNNFSEVSNELLQEIQDEREKKINERDETLVDHILNDIKQNLQKINHHGKRADAIVKGMLQHSRNNSAEKELTDINKLADEYLRLAYHGLRAKDRTFNATLETDFDESMEKISVVPQDLGRVILNLITNAFYVVDEKKKSGIENYTPTVKVSTKKSKETISITVKDNGNGIPKHVLDKIFQPFFTTKPAGKGTGLGLSMSYDIITKGHGGELLVKTEPGIGTEFIINIPR